MYKLTPTALIMNASSIAAEFQQLEQYEVYDTIVRRLGGKSHKFKSGGSCVYLYLFSLRCCAVHLGLW